MPQNDLEIRMENLEHTVASLTGLPKQVESFSTQVQELSTQVQDLSTQFLQLREDVRADISEVRDEMHGIRDELRGEMYGMREELVGKIDGCRSELREEMASMHRDLAAVIATNHAQALTLHEDLVQRITLLGGKFPRQETADAERISVTAAPMNTAAPHAALAADTNVGRWEIQIIDSARPFGDATR